MAWVVDTCLLIDVAESDPDFGIVSADLIDAKRQSGLAVCPITYVELAPVFNGDARAQDEFLRNVGALSFEPWLSKDTLAAFEAWNRYISAKRAGDITKRPIADILIGAFAMRFEGLLTRNGDDFRKLFPKLQIVSP